MSTATQTSALFIDAYRDLQARKLFWITLILSVLVAGVFAFVGINGEGITVFGKMFPTVFNTTLIPKGDFYKLLFVAYAIPVWLGIIASVLGLVSCGGIFPDLISGGSIELYLCRPIGRLRLFLTKYVFALLFMASQVMLFSLASFLVIGMRGNLWEPRIFLAVPLVTLFFSYLYCICVLLGVLTRSALAAILLTILLWFAIWSVHATDAILTSFTVAAEERVAAQQKIVDGNDKNIAAINAQPESGRGNLKNFEFYRAENQKTLAEYEQVASDFRFWQRLTLAVKTPLPKTGETVALMVRWLITPDPLENAEKEKFEQREEWRLQHGFKPREPKTVEQFVHMPQTQRRLREEFDARKVSWIIGTSLGFEAFVLGLAAWIFCRRDY